jgi:hypothetical protein
MGEKEAHLIKKKMDGYVICGDVIESFSPKRNCKFKKRENGLFFSLYSFC